MTSSPVHVTQPNSGANVYSQGSDRSLCNRIHDRGEEAIEVVGGRQIFFSQGGQRVDRSVQTDNSGSNECAISYPRIAVRAVKTIESELSDKKRMDGGSAFRMILS